MPPIAPDFDGGGYPGRGERIGPAWQAAWDLLEDLQAHTRQEVIAVMMEAGGIQDKTAVNLLQRARKTKWIEMDKKRQRHLSMVRRIS